MANPSRLPDSGEEQIEESPLTGYPANAAERPMHDQQDHLSVVGIGASAGGLAALRGFFAALPPDSGITFVVVVHLSAEHESRLAELLQSATAMPVTQVTTRVQMVPNHVYVIPPGKRLFVRDDTLDLAELEMPQGPRMQIDLFFRSLAEVRGEGAAIILSGSGSDGTVGIQAIKEQGGLILVQSPAEAEYDSMPRSALATGLVDVVGPVAELAQQLVAAQQVRTTFALPEAVDHLSAVGEDTLAQILVEVHQRTGNDFQSYKRSTMLRRIGRRMQLTHQRALTGYLDYLRREPEEAHRLVRELVIHVTQFFRDPDAWETLARTVIPQLFVNKGSQDSVRVWTAGCATGEESYTLAMLLLEHAAEQNFRGKIQIFASDLSEEAIAYARAGYYPAAIAADVSEERLARFFSANDSYYRLRDEVRNIILFAQHNLLQDPPFSKLDLLVCRNVLIYFQRDLQERICDFFYNALQPNGYLFLGTSEAAESMSDLFDIVDRPHHIYQRHAEPNRIMPILPVHPYDPARRAGGAPVPPAAADAHRLGLEEMGPPSLLTDANHQVLHLSPSVGRYLVPRGGIPTTDVLQFVRPELQTPLRMALRQTLARDKATFVPPVPVHFDDAPHPVALWVRPVAAEHKQMLILFLEDELAEVEPGPAAGERGETTQEQYLEGELQQSEALRRSSDEHYTTLLTASRAAYDEAQILNEEYRSSLEELETSKEELQSVNEELQLVNQELHEKIDALGQAHNDLENLVLATNVATLFLDRQLHIMRFTPGAAELFNLLPADLGRLITHLRPKVQYEQLEGDARQVMKALTPVLREVYEPSGRWFLVQVLPYRTLEDTLGGVVITFTDITLSKEAEAERRASELRFRQVWEATSDAMVLSDTEGVVLDANPAYLRLYGYTSEQVIGHSFAIIFPPEARESALAQYKQTFASEEELPSFESVVQHADGSQRIVESRATFLSVAGQRTAMLSTIRDITERKQIEEALRQLNETLENRVQERTEQVRSLVTQLTMSEQEERRRISAVLHDDVQQRLYGLNMQLTMLNDLLTQDEQVEERQIIEEGKQATHELIALTRNLSVDLSPPVLHHEGLAAALHWLASQMEQQQRLVVTVVAAENLPVPDEDLRVLLFQFVRELLFNIVKHARVDRASVVLAREDNLLTIQVSDQGQGFDSGIQHDLTSQGLARIKQRLHLMGGYMQIDSRPHEGTRVTLYVPLHGTKRGGTDHG